MARREAQRLLVASGLGGRAAGSTINDMMIVLAQVRWRVVRLKRSELFGRAGEEIEALRAERSGFDVVPGITASLLGVRARCFAHPSR